MNTRPSPARTPPAGSRWVTAQAGATRGHASPSAKPRSGALRCFAQNLHEQEQMRGVGRAGVELRQAQIQVWCAVVLAVNEECTDADDLGRRSHPALCID